MGSRAAYGLGLLDLAKQEPNLLVVTPDTSTSAGLDRFRKKLPTQFFEVGIAEQMASVLRRALQVKVIEFHVQPSRPFRLCAVASKLK